MRLFVPIGLLLLMGGVFIFPSGALQGEDSTDQQNPDRLERELENLVSEGAAHSNDLTRLLRMAGLYLDLGYGVYVDREQKLAVFQEGARLAQKALDLRESSAEAHFLFAANLGSAAELEGLVGAALTIQKLKKHVNRVLELDPENKSFYLLKAELHLYSDNDIEAIQNYLKASELEPSDINILKQIASIKINNKDFENAKDELQKILKIKNDDAETYYKLAFINFKLNYSLWEIV